MATPVKRHHAISVGLVAAVLLVYGQVVNFDFVLYDDTAYVSDNQVVKDGLSWAGITWAFTTFHASNWHPVTWISHMLDVEIWGLYPGGHHLTSVFLHTLNALFLFLILRRVSGGEWRAAMVAALFALHPLHVESVAWIAERKDVLSTLFFLLALGAYIRYTEKPTRLTFMTVTGLFAGGLMAKPMLVTFPFVLVLLDYWPLQRMSVNTDPYNHTDRAASRLFIKLVIEKVPLFCLSAIACVITFAAQDAGGAVATLQHHTLGVRLANASISYLGYLSKMIWPAGLCVYYPFQAVIPYQAVIMSTAALIALSFGAVYWRRPRPWFAVGWCWYLGTLVPVIGVVQVGTQAMADRYTYIPSIGIFIIAVWTGQGLCSRLRLRTFGLFVAGGVLLALALVSHRQVGTWRNSTDLFTQAIRATGNNHEAYHGLGLAAEKTQHFGRAAKAYRTAITIKPDFSEAYISLGALQARMGRYAAAEKNLRQGVHFEPHNAKALNNLGNLKARQGRVAEAIQHFTDALHADPHEGHTYANLGMAYLRIGRIQAAVDNLRRARAYRPADRTVRHNLERTLALQAKIDGSVARLATVLRSAAEDGGHRHYIEIETRLRAVEGALAAYQKALSVLPGYAGDHLKLDNMPVAAAVVSQAQKIQAEMKNDPQTFAE
jgi:tetratricopeptide (TPR) repeat protein